MKIKDYLKKQKNLIDEALEGLIPSVKERPQLIHKAMRYALKGGKRIRPILSIASGELCGAKTSDILKIACCIEMLHAYSLVHDDLPSMDNDDYRRGRPSCHKKFGIANAVLTGDALLTLSFNILSRSTPYPALNSRIIEDLSRAAGTFGMIGGQALDIATGQKDMLSLEYININKTGALIASSCKVGAMAARARKKDIDSLFRFGEYIGLVFQIVDDILDGEGFSKIMGPKRAYEHASELTDKAKERTSYFGVKASPLCAIADFILKRKH